MAKLLPVHAQFTQLAVAATGLANAMNKQSLEALRQQVGFGFQRASGTYVDGVTIHKFEFEFKLTFNREVLKVSADRLQRGGREGGTP